MKRIGDSRAGVKNFFHPPGHHCCGRCDRNFLRCFTKTWKSGEYGNLRCLFWTGYRRCHSHEVKIYSD